jgi:hypothetical protein
VAAGGEFEAAGIFREFAGNIKGAQLKLAATEAKAPAKSKTPA